MISHEKSRICYVEKPHVLGDHLRGIISLAFRPNSDNCFLQMAQEIITMWTKKIEITPYFHPSPSEYNNRNTGSTIRFLR